MEDRKKKEIEFYDQQVDREAGDFEGFNPSILSSYNFLYDFLRDKCKNKKILDFGCGNGIHSIFLAKCGGEVSAIDLSEGQLRIARLRAGKEGVSDKINFIKMDCENLEFPAGYFDIIFDGGTFSSLDLNKALPELSRVLKRDGFLLGIETFGHNPLTNLKRKLNKIRGSRTGWAAEHILKMNNFKTVKNHFSNIEVHFFHLISWAAFPFLKLPGGKFFLKFSEVFDNILLKVSFLRKFAFKVVFIFSKPVKIDA